jgi:hypothetical protein
MTITAILGRAACAVAVGLTLTTVSVAGAATAQASVPCNFRQQNGHWYCDNVHGAPVWYQPNVLGGVAGYMQTRPSWYYCRTDKGGYVGGPHPNRWLSTVADNGKAGWMKDTDIYSETDPLPPC